MSGEMVRSLDNVERIENLKRIPVFVIYSGSICHLVFSVADAYFFPQFSFEFMLYRIANVIVALCLVPVIRSCRKLVTTQLVGAIFVFAWVVPLQLMIYRIGQLDTPYYAGLILVISAVGSGFRFTWPFYFFVIAAAVVPYLFLYEHLPNRPGPGFYWLNFFFLVGLIAVETMNRFFNEKIYQREARLRVKLEHEVLSRDKIIHDRSISLAKLTTADALLARNQQVAHDIRSPLMALGVLYQTNRLPSEEQMMMKTIVDRIQDIANRLARDPSTEPDGLHSMSQKVAIYLLVPMVESIISEKRLECRGRLNIDIDFEIRRGHLECVKLDATEFKRLLSNILNNGIEAIDGTGFVTVVLDTESSNVVLEVKDSGVGVPNEVLRQLGTRGYTYGKRSGTGLGLFHAKTCVEDWGGTLNVRPGDRCGTVVSISLPRSDQPSWLCAEFNVPTSATIGLVVDERLVHLMWERCLPDGVEIRRFANISDLQDLSRLDLVLIDGDLETLQSQLDYIIRNDIAKRCILVTNGFEDDVFRERCKKFGVSVIPRTLVPYVKVHISSNARS